MPQKSWTVHATMAGFAAVLLAAAPALEVGSDAVVPAPTADPCENAPTSDATRECLAQALRGRPAALRFFERLKRDGYLREFMESGRIDVAYVTYLNRGNATSGTLLVNGTPAIVDVNDPATYKNIDVKKHPRYATLAPKGNEELWMDDPGRPFAESTPEGGARFRFKLPLKSCRACPPVGVAVVAFDFDAAGSFRGVTLLDLQAGTGEPFRS